MNGLPTHSGKTTKSDKAAVAFALDENANLQADPAVSNATRETLDLMPDLICIVRPDGAHEYFSKAWRGYASGDPCAFSSRDWIKWIHESDRDGVLPALGRSMKSGLAFAADFRLHHATGRPRWFMLRAQPQTDGAGGIRFWLLILTDIHERKLRKINLTRQLRVQSGMVNASIDCIKVIAPDGTLSQMNRAGCTALNVAEDSGFGMNWIDLLPPEVHEPGRQALEEAMTGKNARFRGMSRLPGESTRHWDNMLTPLMNGKNEVESILCVSRDVTAQREGERRIEMLVQELNHRSKNMLMVILALIKRAVPDSGAEFVKVLEQRIGSIAKSQDLLIHGQWAGASVRDVITSQTAAAGDVEEKRLLLHGEPELQLRPKAAEAIGLAIFELTTNAIKYGALSNSGGTVTIEWSVQDRSDTRDFCLRWKEAGGPAVKPPLRRGFGAVVIERNPRAVLGGTVILHYRPDGVVWELEVPADAVLTV